MLASGVENLGPKFMRRLIAIVVVVIAVAMASVAPSFGAGTAGGNAPLPALPTSPYELVVFEADGCVYCDFFRRDVLPLYAESRVAKEAPVRFVNVSHADETKMGIAYAISIAPTVVLMRDGREVDRITGYTGPGTFVQLVKVMMGRGN